MTPEMKPELKWVIVGDQIGHQSTTKEIVEMYRGQLKQIGKASETAES